MKFRPLALLTASIMVLALSACASSKPKEEPVAEPTPVVEAPAPVVEPVAEPEPVPVAEVAPEPEPVPVKPKKRIVKPKPAPVVVEPPKPAPEPEPVPEPVVEPVVEPIPAVIAPPPPEPGFLEQYWIWLVLIALLVAGAVIALRMRKQ